MNNLTKITTLLFPVTLALGLVQVNPHSASATTANMWDFDFSGNVTGSGSITLDLNDLDAVTNSYLVTNINFSLNFPVGSNPQHITLGNFSLTQPLRFNPENSNSELFSTLGTLQSDWSLGILSANGDFPSGGLNLSGTTGTNLPPDPLGVGGTVLFSGNDLSIATGIWIATPQDTNPSTTPEPTSLLSIGSILAIAYLAKNRKV